jgi:integrase
MEKPNLRLVTPTTENRTVTPQRPPNAELRTREHLTADEVEKLVEAVRQNRYGHRDALMVLLAYRHGLRAAELVDLRWEQVDFKAASLHIRRARTAPRLPILSAGVKCASFAGISGKAQPPRFSSCRNAARRYRRPAFPA